MTNILLMLSLLSPALGSAVPDQCGPQHENRLVAKIACSPAFSSPRARDIILEAFERAGCKSPLRFKIFYRNSSVVMDAQAGSFLGDFHRSVDAKEILPDMQSTFLRASPGVEEYLHISTGLITGRLPTGTLREKRFSNRDPQIFDWHCRLTP